MASTKLTRTNGTATNGQKMTFSTWFKIGTQSSQQSLLSSVTGSGAATDLKIMASATHNNVFRFECITVEGSTIDLKLNRSLRDPSAWYHLVIAVDTTQVTSSNRVKIYINGVQETSFATATYPTQNHTLDFSKTGITQQVGAYSNSNYWDGSMTHIHFIDGTAYTPTSFGEVDATSGIWKAKSSASVTYGNNGFFLKMENSGAMGTDSSGNSNNFTVSGTLTQNVDTPDNNFCTLTPLIRMAITLNNGNTQVTDTDSSWYGVGSTMGVSSGKWYWEYKLTRIGNYAQDGVMGGLGGNGYNDIYNTYVGSKTAGVALNTGEGKIYSADSSTTWFGSANSQGQIIGVALDLDNNKIYYSQNGVFGNSSNPATNTNGYALSATIIANKPLLPCSSINNCTIDYNFGNGFFGTTAVASANADGNGVGKMEYAVPSGYYTLNTKNLKEFG